MIKYKNNSVLYRVDPSFIVDKFFKKDDPVWIRNGQLNDLKELDQSDLRVLYSIDKLPLENVDFIARKMNRPDVLLLLLKRYEMVCKIKRLKLDRTVKRFDIEEIRVRVNTYNFEED